MSSIPLVRPITDGSASFCGYFSKKKEPIKLEQLALATELEISPEDWLWVATELWTFLGDVIDEALYPRRKVLAGGEDDNGVELWRRFNVDHEGGRHHLFGRSPRLPHAPAL